MPKPEADAKTVATIRKQAEKGRFVAVSNQARDDWRAHFLTHVHITDAIVDGIETGEPAKETVLHSFPGRQGQIDWEMRIKIDGLFRYIKLCCDDSELHN